MGYNRKKAKKVLKIKQLDFISSRQQDIIISSIKNYALGRVNITFEGAINTTLFFTVRHSTQLSNEVLLERVRGIFTGMPLETVINFG